MSEGVSLASWTLHSLAHASGYLKVSAEGLTPLGSPDSANNSGTGILLISLPKILLIAVLVVVARFQWAHGADGTPARPRTPQESAACFRLADQDLRIELVANEPDVVSPVAISWDADGRMFVAEMLDYPLGPMRGQVRVLTDTDRDGRYDHSQVFAEDLAFPTSVLPWRDGVLVASAPDILFLRDVDGDGKADERRIVLTGFGEGNQQLRVNGLSYGLDNLVYGANGRSDGDIRRPDRPVAEAVSIRHRDFRFNPDTGDVQAIVGFSQFGLPRDDWGHRFPSWNTIPIRHVVLDEPSAATASRFDAASAVASIVDPQDDGRVFSISPRPLTFNSESTDFYNAMCGLTIFRGDALGQLHGQAFVGESLTNLVHRRLLEPSGPTFVARRIDQQIEFLASSDNWFHPVFLTTGPDGALYIADFYRRFVEHPNFAAAHLKQGVDWREGVQHGRIWRIVRRDQSGLRPVDKLSGLTSEQLVARLNDGNGWQRDTAQRLLVERRDPKSIPLLQTLVRQRRSPLATLHALWTLSGVEGLNEATILEALYDKDTKVRIHGIRLSGPMLPESDRLRAAILEMSDDSDPGLRLELAQAFVRLDDPTHPVRLARLAAQPDADRWLFDVLGSVADDRAWRLIATMLEHDQKLVTGPTETQAHFLATLASRVAAHPDSNDMDLLLDLIAHEIDLKLQPGCAALISGIDSGLEDRQVAFRRWLIEPPPSRKKSLTAIARVIDSIVREPRTIPEVPNERTRVIQLLKLADPSLASGFVLRLIQSSETAAVQTAAANAVVGWNDVAVIAGMLKDWGRYSPSTRQIVQSACLRGPIATEQLIGSMESGGISPWEIDQTSRVALGRIPDGGLRLRAETVLRALGQSDRQQVLHDYQSTLTLDGNPEKGVQLFATHCASCHRIQGVGHIVGPDLSAIAARPKEALLVDVLDPSRQVAPDFMSYTLVTSAGKIYVGLVSGETAGSVTLRRAEGAQDTIIRSDIEELRATGKSLMPDGMEKKLDQQALADLFSFLYRPDVPRLKQLVNEKR